MPESMVKAVQEYYEWHHQRNIHPIRVLKNKYNDAYQAILVRLIDDYGDKISTLMDFTRWKDGHYDVTEFHAVCRKREKELVSAFVNTPGGI